MMQKFRVWHKELERLMSVQIMWLDEGEISELELNDSLMNESIPVYRDDVILMQSTGLVDKNGKEIFEGDVVELVDEYGDSGMSKVVSQEGALGMIIEEVFVPFATMSILSTVDYTLEVIGNIYENPELVEGING